MFPKNKKWNFPLKLSESHRTEVSSCTPISTVKTPYTWNWKYVQNQNASSNELEVHHQNDKFKSNVYIYKKKYREKQTLEHNLRHEGENDEDPR